MGLFFSLAVFNQLIFLWQYSDSEALPAHAWRAFTESTIVFVLIMGIFTFYCLHWYAWIPEAKSWQEYDGFARTYVGLPLDVVENQFWLDVRKIMTWATYSLVLIEVFARAYFGAKAVSYPDLAASVVWMLGYEASLAWTARQVYLHGQTAEVKKLLQEETT